MKRETVVAPQEFDAKKYQRYVIVASVGENKTYIAVLGIIDHRNYDIILKHFHQTNEKVKMHELLNDCLADAFNEYKIECNRGVIAGSGPIPRRREYLKLTNIDYTIDLNEILRNTMLSKVILLNDYEAIGYGINVTDIQKDCIELAHVGVDLTKSTSRYHAFAAIGVGSGLGVSIAYYDQTKHMHAPIPSEGGHTEFAVHDDLEFELLLFLRKNVLSKKEAHPEYERVLSHAGLMNIYNFVRFKKMLPDTNVTAKIDLMDENEKVVAIGEHLDDPTCNKAVELFIKFYARFSRNIALTSQCYAGLFLTGDMATKFMHKFQDGNFMREFESHDKRNDVLRKIPVYIVKKKDIALYGCCNVAMNFYNLND